MQTHLDCMTMDEQGSSLTLLTECLLGPVRMAVLHAALEFGLADILAETGDPEEIARRLESHTGNTRSLLDALVALGLAGKRQGCYANTPFAERYLRRGSSTYLGSMIVSLARMQHRHLAHLPQLVRQGPPPLQQEERLDDEMRWRQAALGLANYQRAGLAGLAVDVVAALPEAPRLRRMLDLGGGPGLVGMAIVERFADLCGTLCDLPSVITVAEEEIVRRGLSNRIRVVAGDYNTVDLGEDYDLVWASHTLYYARDLPVFLARVHESMSPGGVLLSLHEGLRRERTEPADCVLSRLSLALEGQDVSFEAGQITQALLAAGFRTVESRIVAAPMGEARLDIARKGVSPGRAMEVQRG